MPEKIYINGFAGLHHFEMELNCVTVLIGPQASGKSVVAKLVYFCRTFPFHFEMQFDKYGSTEVNRLAQEELSKIFHTNVFNQDFEIKYQSSLFEYVIKNTGFNKTLQLYGVEKNLNDKDSDYNKMKDGLYNLLKEQFGFKGVNYKDHFTMLSLLNKVKFIPASRALLTQVRQIRLKVFDEGIQSSIDTFLARFVATYHQIRDNYIKQNKSLTTNGGNIVSLLIDKILKADIEFINNEDYLIYKDGRRNALTQASSGEQALVPVLLELKFLYETSPLNGASIIFEEPELHIFPKFQNLLLKLLLTVFNKIGSDGMLFITTHSPYILTYLNNLLQAGEMEKHLNKEKLKALDELVAKECRINPKEFSAFQITNGKPKKINDEDTGLISENIIDEVSDKDFDLFNKLMEIQYGVEN